MVRLFNISLFCVFAFSCLPMQGMQVARAAAQHAVSASHVVRTAVMPNIGNRAFSVKSQMSNIASQCKQKYNANRANVYSLLYGGGMLVGLGTWLWTSKQEQKKDLELKQKQTQEQALQIDKPVALSPFVHTQVAAQEEKTEYVRPWEHFMPQLHATLQQRAWGQISKKNINELEQEKQKIMHDIFSFFGITQADWNKFQAKQYQKYMQHMQHEVQDMMGSEPDPEHVLKIDKAFKNAAKKIGLDAADISIINAPSIGMRFMSVKGTSIVINPTMCNRVGLFENEQRLETSLMRESLHLVQDDGFTQYCLAQLYESKKDRDKGGYELLEKKLSHFQEQRADILCSLTDETYAKMGYEVFNVFAHPPFWVRAAVGLFGHKVDTMLEKTHPPFSARYEYSKKLHEEIVAAGKNGGNND